MTPEIERLLAALRAYPLTVPPENVIAVLDMCGFICELELERTWVYSHPERVGPPVTVPKQGPLLPAFVRKAVDAIEEVVADEN